MDLGLKKKWGMRWSKAEGSIVSSGIKEGLEGVVGDPSSRYFGKNKFEREGENLDGERKGKTHVW